MCQVLLFIRRARARPPAAAAGRRPPRPALMHVRLLALLMAAGLESLPHVEMWRDLPALVRDGIVFSVDTLKSARRRDHYQTVL